MLLVSSLAFKMPVLTHSKGYWDKVGDLMVISALVHRRQSDSYGENCAHVALW